MDTLPPLPPTHTATRTALHRVAVHVVARRRNDRSGRFGLRAAPGGLASPATGAGDDLEVVRTDGDLLVVERGGAAATATMSDLATLAAAVGVDLTAPFAAGTDTPPLGDADDPLGIDARAARVLGTWWTLATTILDDVTAWLGAGAAPSVVQVWPEHFDVACDVAWGPGEGRRVNLGGSPGDAGHEAPYLYVGPWGAERSGDTGYWNAPFGALLGYEDLRASDDPRATGAEFMRRGLELLAAG